MNYKIVRFQKLMWRNMIRLTKSKKALILYYESHGPCGESTRDSPSIPHISLYQPMTNPTVQIKPNQIKPNPNRTQAWVSLEWFNPIQPFPL